MCQEFFIVNEIRRTAQKKKILHCLKRTHSKQFALLFLSSLFPAEVEALAPVLSRLIDVVVVNFVVVLKFPIDSVTKRLPKHHSQVKGILHDCLGSANRSLIIFKTYLHVQRARGTVFTSATKMCLFHLFRQTAIAAMF